MTLILINTATLGNKLLYVNGTLFKLYGLSHVIVGCIRNLKYFNRFKLDLKLGNEMFRQRTCADESEKNLKSV